VNATAYSLSPFEWYENALGDETAKREELPIVEAISGGLPAEFAAIWRSDVLRWEQRQQPTTAEDITHGRENSQTRENSEARVLPGVALLSTTPPKSPPLQLCNHETDFAN
jgi:hypothetical protein